MFICDSCVYLCEDILWTDNNNRFGVRIKLPIETPIDDAISQTVEKILQEAFPEYDIKYEFRTPSLFKKGEEPVSLAIYSINAQPLSPNSEKMAKEIRELSAKLDVVTRRYIEESEKVKNIKKEIMEIKSEYLDILREKYKDSHHDSTDLRLVMFLDVSGFSKFTKKHKESVVVTLRGVAPSLLGERGAQEINMWGDAIVANFVDAKEGILAAIKFLRHLEVEGLHARIGMAWGAVGLKFNPATDRRDIHGEVVDFAARLEQMAKIGTILCAPEIVGLEIPAEVASLKSVKREVQKSFANVKAGDVIDLYEIEYLKN